MPTRHHVPLRYQVIAFMLLTLLLVPAGHARAWTFIVTGDSRGDDNGVNTPILGEVAREIARQKPDFVLFPGDLVDGGADQEGMYSQFKTWRDTMDPVYRAGIKVYPVRGNHDLGKGKSHEAWNRLFIDETRQGGLDYTLPQNGPAKEKNLTYAATHKNALVLVLDQYTQGHQVNQGWVDQQLAASKKRHVFTLGHEPAFRALHGDCLDNELEARDAFIGSLEKAGGRTYFAGHDHFFDVGRADKDGNPDNDFHQYIVGTAGAPPYQWDLNYEGHNSDYTLTNAHHAAQYGYVIVSIKRRKATLTWMERTAPDTFEAKHTWSYKAR